MPRFLRPKEAASRVGMHKVTVMRKARNPDDSFPEMVQLSRHSVAFVEAEIDAWMAERMAERPGAPDADPEAEAAAA